MATYSFNGQAYNFPDDVSQEEALAFIDSQHPQEAAPAAPQSTQPAADKESLGYALSHPGEAFSALGNALTTGAAKWLMTDHSTGETVEPQGAARDWYREQMANPETAANAAVVADKAIPLALGATTAIASDGLLTPLFGTGVFGTVATAAGSGAVGSLTSQVTDQQAGIDLGQVGLDTLLGGGFGLVGKGVGAIASKAKNIIPEWLGGASQAEKAATAANPEEIERMYQGGNVDRQTAYRTATTDAEGNIITPSSTLYSEGGEGFRQTERRELAANNPVYTGRQATAQEGAGLSRAIDEMAGPNAKGAQGAIQDATAAFKAQKNQLYNESLSKAQDLLDQNNVSSLKMNRTKDLAGRYVSEDADLESFSPSAKKLLTKISNQKFTSLHDIDFIKQKLTNEANKAFRAGDYDSMSALNSVKAHMKTELDSTLGSLSPDAKSAYTEADQYFSQFVDDFGAKSQAGKVAANESEARATNALLANSDIARERTANIAQSLQDAADSGNFAGADQLGANFAEGLGNTSRLASRDYARLRGNVAEAGTTGTGDQTFQRTLRQELQKDMPQMQSVSGLGSGDQAAKNQLLIDASKSLEGTEVTQSGIIPRIVNAIGNKTPFMPHNLGDLVADPVSRLTSRATRTTARDLANREYMANPNNLENLRNISRKIQDGTYQSDSALMNLASETQRAAGVAPLFNENAGEPQQSAPEAAGSDQPLLNIFGNATPQGSDTEPQQRAQAAKKPNAEAPQPVQDQGVNNLYSAFADAETGNISDPFIRTKAAEGGKPSSAFGPLQITRDLMKDFLNSEGANLTESERDYVKRFIAQGDKFLKAKPNDPKYGYGKGGDLNSPEDRQMYDIVGPKVLKMIVDRNGNSFNKTVKAWRGKSDAAYTRKVRNSFTKRQSWSKPATA
ncbi:hypothetical protein ABFK60_001224 [Escherichia coli O13/129/135:H4]